VSDRCYLPDTHPTHTPCSWHTPDTHLHYPVEGEALGYREHEHRTEEHDVRFADREPW